MSDLERSLAFYQGVLGFARVTRSGPGPRGAAFLSAGGYHHHIGLNTWRMQGATPPPAGHTGLYHFAVRFASRAVQGATDHGVSHSVYLADPDGNGLELTADLPREEWPLNACGEPEMFAGKALDLNALLS